MYSVGKRFVGRYFGPGGDWKHATPAECGGLIASGLSLFAMAEGEPTGALGGSANGRAYAQSAAKATRACGMPDDRPIYFAVDFDMVTGQRNAVSDFLTGAASVVGADRVGLYSGYRTISWAQTEGLAAWFHQTYAWSQGKWSPASNIEQYSNHQTVCGATVDLDRSKTVDFGQWPHPTESFGTVPDSAAPVVTSGPWDWTDVIAGQTADVASLGAWVGSYQRDLDGLRTN